DANAEKELLDLTDNYVIENSIKKVIKDKKRNAISKVRKSATPEKCNDTVSKQKHDGFIEISETVCEEIDVSIVDVVPTVKKYTQNKKLRSPQSEPWWKTALTLSYLKIAAPHHKKLWEDKYNKARKYLSKQIGDAAVEKELLDCSDKYVVDNVTKKVEKDHKKDAAITIVQEAASPEKHKEIVSKQKDDGSIELDDTVCKELDFPKEDIITTIQKNITNKKLQLPQLPSLLSTAVNLSYLKNAASQYEGKWRDKYNKARKYLSKQIGDKNAEEELIKFADEYVVDKLTDKVIEEKKRDVIDLKKAHEYLSNQIRDTTADCTDKYAVDNATEKFEKDHKKDAAITIVQKSTSSEKCEEIVSKQKDDGSIELDDSICNELDASKEEIIITIQKKVKNSKLKSLEYSSSLATAINISYLKNIAPHHEGLWKDKYNKAREYLSRQIEDKNAEEDLIKCADEYIIVKVINKVIENEVPKSEKPKGFVNGIYEVARKLGDQVERALTFNKDKLDDNEKAEALIIVGEAATPEKCKEIISNQKDDGFIELGDSVCNELDTPKEEIITTIQKKIKNDKLKSPEHSSCLATAINLAYLKKAAPHHEGLWKDRYTKAREYLSKQIGDKIAEEELIKCADDYVVENCTKKVIKNKKRNAVVTVQNSTTPEKCYDAISKQNDDGSFEISETICKEIDVLITEVVTTVKKDTQNEKLKSPDSEPWWKTALILSYLKVAAPHYENLWNDKYNKARDYLSKQIGNPAAEKELLDCTDKYIVDNVTKKVVKDYKKAVTIPIVQEAASPEKCEEIELDDSVCKELDAPKEDIIIIVTKKKYQLHKVSKTLVTAINPSDLKNAASQYEDGWRYTYNKTREYFSKKIGNEDTDKNVVDDVTKKVVQEVASTGKCNHSVPKQKDDDSIELDDSFSSSSEEEEEPEKQIEYEKVNKDKRYVTQKYTFTPE
ncbi:13738_t:CDS:2, partial [Dentiscutata heterogama]